MTGGGYKPSHWRKGSSKNSLNLASFPKIEKIFVKIKKFLRYLKVFIDFPQKFSKCFPRFSEDILK